MPAPRRPASIKEITEAFSDFSTADQEGLLSTLTEICRILKRERSRSGTITLPVEELRRGSKEWAATLPTELPTEWLTSPDAEKEQRLAMNTEYRDHEA